MNNLLCNEMIHIIVDLLGIAFGTNGTSLHTYKPFCRIKNAHSNYKHKQLPPPTKKIKAFNVEDNQKETLMITFEPASLINLKRTKRRDEILTLNRE